MKANFALLEEEENLPCSSRSSSFASAERAPTKKKKRPRERRTSSQACLVCGDVGSGEHYGAVSCNGCKTFFRRVILENRSFSCMSGGGCLISRTNRCCCRSCRLSKCLRIGMSTDEVRKEQRRKQASMRFLNTTVKAPPDVSLPSISSDSLVSLLHERERRFFANLTSSSAAVYESAEHALAAPCTLIEHKAPGAKTPSLPTSDLATWRAKFLSTIAEWAKAFEAFGQLSAPDRLRLFVHSAFSVLCLCEAWYTPARYVDRVAFPCGAMAYRTDSSSSSASTFARASALVTSSASSSPPSRATSPSVASVIDDIAVPLRRITLTNTEFLLLKALLLFDPECATLSASARRVAVAQRKRLTQSLRAEAEGGGGSATEAACRIGAVLLRIRGIEKAAAVKRSTILLAADAGQSYPPPHPLSFDVARQYADTSFF